MTKERALDYWINRYNSAKDYSDIHWDAEERHEHRDYIEAMAIAIKALEAADVQHVRHGRWELTNNPSFRKCSECGAWWGSDITNNCFTNYCPKCGARMIKDSDTNG